MGERGLQSERAAMANHVQAHQHKLRGSSLIDGEKKL